MKKFELIREDKINWSGRILYRIKACTDFTTTSGVEVKAGDLGGYVENESNLSQMVKRGFVMAQRFMVMLKFSAMHRFGTVLRFTATLWFTVMLKFMVMP